MSHWHWIKIKVCSAHFIHVSSACCVLLDSPRLSLLIFASHLLSHLPFHSPDHLHLPRGRQEPCALLQMRKESGTIAENNPLKSRRGKKKLMGKHVERHTAGNRGINYWRQYRKCTTQRHRSAEGETFAYKYRCALAQASRALVDVRKIVWHKVERMCRLEDRIGERPSRGAQEGGHVGDNSRTKKRSFWRERCFLLKDCAAGECDSYLDEVHRASLSEGIHQWDKKMEFWTRPWNEIVEERWQAPTQVDGTWKGAQRSTPCENLLGRPCGLRVTEVSSAFSQCDLEGKSL